jgi:hypothetical protein
MTEIIAFLIGLFLGATYPYMWAFVKNIGLSIISKVKSK